MQHDLIRLQHMLDAGKEGTTKYAKGAKREAKHFRVIRAFRS